MEAISASGGGWDSFRASCPHRLFRALEVKVHHLRHADYPGEVVVAGVKGVPEQPDCSANSLGGLG